MIRESEFPAVTARRVADTIEMERRPAHPRLEELYERGELERGEAESAGGYLVNSRSIEKKLNSEESVKFSSDW